MNKYLIIASLLLATMVIHAQTLEVELPYHAGRGYYFCLLQGTQQDTIATGRLNMQGKATISLPVGYRGVGRFTVEGYDRIRNVVVNGNENIFMSEADSLEAETVFTHSPENSFLIEAMAKQNRLIREFYQVANSQKEESLVLAPAEQRMQMIENTYKSFHKEISDSPLYATRIIEILNLLTGVGSSFTVSEQELLDDQRGFIVNKVNFNDLYTSGFWQKVLEAWLQITSQDDTLLLANARHMLDRCGNDIPIRRELTQTIIRLFSKYGKDSLLAELGTEYLTMPLNGQTAPLIVTAEGSFLPESSLIVFYETGCGNCHYELENLKDKYQLLTDNNIRVVSISADTDNAVFHQTANKLPWKDKLCDFKGFNGENFSNYGIVGTPTFILTDDHEIVRGRYASIKELLKE